MFESIVPLLPRHPFEAGGSVADERLSVPFMSSAGKVLSPYSKNLGHFLDHRLPMVCPMCVQEVDYGTHAVLWPHQAAWVDACPRHGVRLVRMDRAHHV